MHKPAKASNQLSYSDHEVISAIRDGQPDLEKVMHYLYNGSDWKPTIFYFVAQNGGTDEDAEDVFQEGIRRMFFNIKNKEFEKRSALKTYLYVICRNVWISQLRKKNKWRDVRKMLEAGKNSVKSPHQLLEHKEMKEQVEQITSVLTEVCRKVLKLWTLGYSMKEIAQKVGYKNDGVAKKKKRLCLQKLMQEVQDHPELMKALLKD